MPCRRGTETTGCLPARSPSPAWPSTSPTTLTGFTTSLTGVIDPGNVMLGWTLVGNTLTMSGLEQLLIQTSAANTGRVAVTLRVEGGGTPTTGTPTTGTPSTGSVPEPGLLSLFGAGVALLVRRRVSSAR